MRENAVYNYVLGSESQHEGAASLSLGASRWIMKGWGSSGWFACVIDVSSLQVLFSCLTLWSMTGRASSLWNTAPVAQRFLGICLPMWNNTGKEHLKQQGSAVADRPARCAASWRMCCKQIRWTLSVINLRSRYVDSTSRWKLPICSYRTCI